jgi:hypothetical protein
MSKIMSKSGLAIFTIIITLTGTGFSQSVTATQIRSLRTLPMINPTNINHLDRPIAIQIAKCTIRRYRRPH